MKAEELLAHHNFLSALARSLVYDENRAADITQDTYLTALQKPPARQTNVRAWLAEVAKNFSRTMYRGESRRAAREKAVSRPEGVPSSEEIVAEEELRRKVVEAVLALDERYRSPIVLCFYKNLTQREAAKRLDLPLPTLRFRLKRGLDRLRSLLDVDFGGRKKWVAALALAVGIPVPGRAAGASALTKGIFTGGVKVKVAASLAFIIGATFIFLWSVMPEGPKSVTPSPSAKGPILEPADARDSDELSNRLSRSGRVAIEPEQQAALESARNETRLTGRFLDQDGFPVAGVRVMEEYRTSSLMAESGPDGRFEGVFVSDEEDFAERIELAFKRTGFASQEKEILPSAGSTIHLGDIVLEPGGDVAGRVKDSAGRPMEGAWVEFTDGQALEVFDPEYLRRWGNDQLDVIDGVDTDSKGFFLLEGMPLGWGRVWACDEGTLNSYSEVIEIRPGEKVTDIELILEPVPQEEIIEGIVLSPEGEPAPDAEVHCLCESSWMRGSEKLDVDENGRFRFILGRSMWKTLKRGEEIKLNFEASDPQGRYGPVRMENVQLGTQDLWLQLMPSMPFFRLSCKGPGGRAVEEFEVHVGSTGISSCFSPTRTFKQEDVGEDGTVEVFLPPNPFSITIEAEGYLTFKMESMNPSALPDPVEAVLVPVARAEGKVTHGDRPVAGVRVFTHKAGDPGGTLTVDGFLSRYYRYCEESSVTDRQGRFSIPVKESGFYFLRAEAAGYAPADAGPFVIDRDEGMEDIEIRLKKAGAIQGRIITPDGQDGVNLIVGICRADGHPKSMRTGPGGAYSFTGLTPGRWLVKLLDEEIPPYGRSSGWRSGEAVSEYPWSCIVEEEKTTYFDLRMPASSTCVIEGRLILDKSVLVGWTAALKDADDSLISNALSEAGLAPDGRFALDTTEPGTYRLCLYGLTNQGTMLALFDRVTLESGKNPEWSLDLELGFLRVNGKADLERGEVRFLPLGHNDGTLPTRPLPEFLHTWRGPGDLKSYAEIQPSSDGDPRLTLVPAGSGRIVRIVPIDTEEEFIEEAVKEVQVPADGTVSIEL